MHINPVSNIYFKNQIKVRISDKSRSGSGFNDPYLSSIMKIADKEGVGVFIAEDVIILSSSKNIKNELTRIGCEFEEVGILFKWE